MLSGVGSPSTAMLREPFPAPSLFNRHAEPTCSIFLGAEWSPVKDGDCESCYVFHDILYGNEQWTVKFSRHAHNDDIQHAVLVVEHLSEAIPAKKYIADLSTMDAERVQKMSVDYCTGCAREGLRLIRDFIGYQPTPMATKMDSPDLLSLNTGNYQSSASFLGSNESLEDSDSREIRSRQTPLTIESPKKKKSAETKRKGKSVGVTKARGKLPHAPKLDIKIQRMRSKAMTFEQISNYFHLPVIEACKELDIGSTALKKICRKFHIKRWPYRKVMATEKHHSKSRQVPSSQSSSNWDG